MSPTKATSAVPFPGGQPRAFDRRESQALPDQGPIHTEAGSLDQIERQATPSEEDVEGVEPRRHAVPLDPGDRGLGHARRAGELALREPGSAPSFPENRPRSHP